MKTIKKFGHFCMLGGFDFVSEMVGKLPTFFDMIHHEDLNTFVTKEDRELNLQRAENMIRQLKSVAEKLEERVKNYKP